MNFWSSSLFKGRIGEALVEAVLLEFGYKVVRSGYEYQKNDNKINDYYLQSNPDLVVIDPKTKNQITNISKHTVVSGGVRLSPVSTMKLRSASFKRLALFLSTYGVVINI